MGRVLDQGGQPQPTLARTITDDRPEKDPIQRTEASPTLSSDSIPALNPAPSPSQPRASFTISANFILPSSATIEIHRLISHKLKSLMGIHSRSFPSSRQTRSVATTTKKKKKNTWRTLRLFHMRRRRQPLQEKPHTPDMRPTAPGLVRKGRESRQCGCGLQACVIRVTHPDLGRSWMGFQKLPS